MVILNQNNNAFPLSGHPRLSNIDVDPTRPLERMIIRMTPDDTPPTSIRGEKKLMDPFPEKIDRSEDTKFDYSQPTEYNEIERKASREKDEAYLRLSLHVEKGKMSLNQARKVDGPLLIEEDRIDGDLAYEVILSSKRIALGSIMDVGVIRSYPNPYGVPDQEGHFFVELPSYQFDVRIPAKDLSISLLPQVEIILYEVKSPINNIISAKSLADQFRNEIREVTRLKGINIQALSKQSQTEIYNLFR